MSATGKTTNYDLAIYQPDDVTSWLTDFNGNMEKIDAALKQIADQGGSGGGSVNVVQGTGQSTTDVMSQKATTDALNSKAGTAEIAQKQNLLIFSGEGQNIKTVGGQSLEGAGDIPISGGGGSNVSIFASGTEADMTAKGIAGYTKTITVPAGIYLIFLWGQANYSSNSGDADLRASISGSSFLYGHIDNVAQSKALTAEISGAINLDAETDIVITFGEAVAATNQTYKYTIVKLS